MGVIYNATRDEQTIRALGNWFTFKPGQIKVVNDNLATWISEHKKEHGLVALPQSFEEPEFKLSEEGKSLLELAQKEGLANYLAFHRSVIANNQISLRRDLEQANIKADPAIYASDGEMDSMRIVARYAASEDDAAQKKAEEVKELMKKVKK